MSNNNCTQQQSSKNNDEKTTNNNNVIIINSNKIGRHGNRKSDFDLKLFQAFEVCRSKYQILRTDPLASNVQRRRLPGKLNLIAVHEPDLFVHKRPATIPSNVPIDEPFDPKKFNFTKISNPTMETLIEITIDDDENDDDGGKQQQQQQQQRHPILINVSPLMYGHGLLIPWIQQHRPQKLTSDVIRLALQVLTKLDDDDIDDHDDDHDVDKEEQQEGDIHSDGIIGRRRKQQQQLQQACERRVGFNSLGAFSSVNHLHLHILYPDELDRAGENDLFVDGAQGFPIEQCPIKQTVIGIDKNNNEKTTTIPSSCTSCQVDLLDWKVPCFSFQIFSLDCIVELETQVSKFVTLLQEKKYQIPHNVLFCRYGSNRVRVICMPRQPQHHFNANKAGFNAALGEISGYLVSRTLQDYISFEEEHVVGLFQKYVACDESTIQRLCQEIIIANA